MDINRYTGCFHDGTILSIKHKDRDIILLLESGYINPNDLEKKICLSKANTLIGKLFLLKVIWLDLDGEKCLETQSFQKQFDDGEILDLKIVDNRVDLLIEWKNFPPKPRECKVSKIKIEAEKVYWEPIPDLDVSQF